MPSYLRIAVRFIDPIPTFHGQRDDNEPEWPPSPLRLFQALLSAATSQWHTQQSGEYGKPALAWLEELSHPCVIAPTNHFGIPFRLSGPNNDMDSPAKEWIKGRDPIKPHRPVDLRTMKTVHRSYLIGSNNQNGDVIHYLYPLPDGACPHLDVLKAAARSITHLGWGIDMAIGDAAVLSAEQVAELEGVRWHPSPAGGTPLRVPKAGTLDDLIRKHTDFLNRVSGDGFHPVPPLRVFDIVRYRSQHEPAQRPFRLFELRNLDGSRFRYSHRKLIHIAGMVRHLAIEAMKHDLPRGVGKDWVRAYVAGHQSKEDKDAGKPHAQFSYIPLPSIGHTHTHPAVRRVMIAAPAGDDAWLNHVARRLGGQQLQALNEHRPEFGMDEDGQPNPGPILVPLPRNGDSVTRRYTDSSSVWYSFTPVILPGHNDHKRDKTHKLIERALIQAGIEQPCEFEWSAFSRFRKSYSAHKYDKDKRPQGYIRPNHLLSQTAVHLMLRFHDGSDKKVPVQVPGPIALGAGRHCGFGLFAAQAESGE